MKNINWTVRLKNPWFWIQMVCAVAAPVASYFGLSGSDITTWGTLWDTIVAVALNPYVLALVAISVWNAVNDPTTAGLSDSTRALTYVKPYPKNEELPVDIEEV